MLKIQYLVHSTSLDNCAGIVSGLFNSDLSEIGLKQATRLSALLKKSKFKPGHIFSSPLLRSQKTAKIIFPEEEIKFDDRLVEIDYGELTHVSKETIDEVRLRHLKEKYPNGESYQDVEQRLLSFLETFKLKNEITVISHQAPQLALEVICNKKTWEQAFSEDWRLKEKGWQPFWEYLYP